MAFILFIIFRSSSKVNNSFLVAANHYTLLKNELFGTPSENLGITKGNYMMKWDRRRHLGNWSSEDRDKVRGNIF